MEILPAPLNKEAEELLRRSLRASVFLFGGLSYSLTDIYLLIWRENVWNFAGVQDVINILKEALHLDMIIRKYKGGRLTFAACLLHQLLEVFSPLYHSIILFDFNLEGLEVCNL